MILPLPEERAAWVDALEAIYELQLDRERPVASSGESEHAYAVGLSVERIAGEADLTREAIRDALDVLCDLGLAAGNVSDDTLDDFGLTADGMAMAHRVKTERQHRRTNQHLLGISVHLLLVLTFAIAL
ncbi:hypothetical protein [Salinarchaeum laminariae]|uniref:hypothetical protein n=1 Tax=Salinarchaeum laminariae TaxID=869888 RepID=UPI0020BE90DB|nr:hypothetical protein [Salinarchaeum laminariae]